MIFILFFFQVGSEILSNLNEQKEKINKSKENVRVLFLPTFLFSPLCRYPSFAASPFFRTQLKTVNNDLKKSNGLLEKMSKWWRG
jgi:hypothetical protein